MSDVERTYERPDPKIRYRLGYDGPKVMERSVARLNPATMTYRVLGGYVTAEVLDQYLEQSGGWQRVRNADESVGTRRGQRA